MLQTALKCTFWGAGGVLEVVGFFVGFFVVFFFKPVGSFVNFHKTIPSFQINP